MVEEAMGICLSTAEVCIKTADKVVNDFLDRQSSFYNECKLAKECLGKKNAAANIYANIYDNDMSHVNSVLQLGLLPIYPSLPDAAQKNWCRNVYDGDMLTLEDDA